MKPETRAFIEELKLKLKLEKMHQSNLIDFNNYFKYSGKIETSNLTPKVKKVINEVKIYNINNSKENLIIDYYHRNSNSPLHIIAEDLNVAVATIRKVLSKHFENNLIKKS